MWIGISAVGKCDFNRFFDAFRSTRKKLVAYNSFPCAKNKFRSVRSEAREAGLKSDGWSFMQLSNSSLNTIQSAHEALNTHHSKSFMQQAPGSCFYKEQNT